MKRLLIISCLVSLVGPAQTAGAQTFRNCSALKAKYPEGIAVNFGVIGRSGAIINRELYLKNQRLDKDRDGIVCENELKQNPPTTTIPLTCAQRGKCGVGDVGPGGGIIFYVSPTAESWGNALEAAPLTVAWSGTFGQDPTAKWGCAGFSIQGAKARGIGSGAENTRAILVGCPGANTGAKLADDLIVGGKDDWFLPSIDELTLLYRNRSFLSDLSKRIYMSSTEVDASNAVLAGFHDGVMGGGGSKDGSWFVRPIRYVVASSVDTSTRTRSAQATCAQGGQCNIGDVGPGGGIVFYARLDGGTFTVKYSRCNTQCRYLEFATPTVGTKWRWATSQYSESLVPNGTKREIGTGYENTINILSQGNYSEETAAAIAQRSRMGGQSDWYLPSIDELKRIFSVTSFESPNLKSLLSDRFWSSTEGSGLPVPDSFVFKAAATYGLGDVCGAGWTGECGGGRWKTEAMNVIPIRAF